MRARNRQWKSFRAVLSNLEAMKTDQSSGARDHFECGHLMVPSLFSVSSNASWWDEPRRRYPVLTLLTWLIRSTIVCRGATCGTQKWVALKARMGTTG